MQEISPEWSLLLVSLLPEAASKCEDSLEGLLLRGKYPQILQQGTVQRLLGFSPGASQASISTTVLHEWLKSVSERAIQQAKSGDAGVVLFTAVAALHIFLQANLTGPPVEAPNSPLKYASSAADLTLESSESNGHAKHRGLGVGLYSDCDRWAVQQLSVDGEEVDGKCFLPQYLLLARTLLLAPLVRSGILSRWARYYILPAGVQQLLQGCQQGLGRTRGKETSSPGLPDCHLGENASQLPATWLWWTARCLAQQQRLIQGSSASLRAALLQIVPKTQRSKQFPILLSPKQSLLIFSCPYSLFSTNSLDSSSTAAQVLEGVERAYGLSEVTKAQLLALASLEGALVEHLYSHPAGALKHLAKAQEVSEFSAELTGALGLRTQHQVDPKAQLVVLTSRRMSETPPPEAEESALLDAAAAGEASLQLSGDSASASDILEQLKIVDDSGTSGDGYLDPLQQAILLALSEQQKQSTAKDELQQWQVAAFADAVLAQSHSRYVLRIAARLHRVRFERSRTRTRERALLGMEQLTEAANASYPQLPTRTCFAFTVLLPLKAALRRELGEQLVAAGLVGAAMEIFEQLELWDNLLICYRLLGKVPQALTLVKERLETTPDDARLLCALGDLTLEPEHYQQAWDRSGGRSARAQRSLARFAMNKNEFREAAEHWELALAFNPLHPDGWFSLGYCFLKAQSNKRAAQAFSRCTQQQPDNGEAWNNIAAIHLQDSRFKEAFSALSEAVKYKRDSWQTWSNYAAAAVKIGNYSSAARAVKEVGCLTQWQKQDISVLQALVLAVETSRKQAGTYGQPQPGSAGGGGRLLEQSVQSVLSTAANSAAVEPAVWGLIAQLNQALGYPDSARDALRRQVRGLAGMGWQHDRQRFCEYTNAVLSSARFAQSQQRIAAKGAAKDLSSSRMLLQSITKNAAEQMRVEPVFKEAEEILVSLSA